MRLRVGLVAVAMVLVVSAPAAGQRARTLVGVTAGAAVSDMDGGIVNTSSRWGFMGGAFGLFRTSRNSVVGLEASYVQKGGENVAKLGYIDIPLTIGAVIPTDNDNLNFNFYTGIGFGIKVSCSADETTVVSAPCDRAKGTEWTWPVGLSMAVRSASGRYFGLDARYSIGISDAFDGSAARNRSWQFRALFGVPVR